MRPALLVALALSLMAVSDTEPWESVTIQKEFRKPTRFDRDVNADGPLSAAFIDAGVATVATLNTTTETVTTLKVAVLDAGVALINGQLQVSGPIRADTATLTIATIDAGQILDNGALQVLGGITGATETLSGTLGVTGVTTLVALDAGAVRVQGVFAPIAKPIDGGSPQAQIQYGNCTLSANACTITFNPAYSVIPMCVCSSTNATAAACDASATSTTQTVLKGANAADVVMFQCIGDK